MSDDEPYRGIDIHADPAAGDYILTDDELAGLRSAARLTLTEGGSFFELDGALRTFIVLADQVGRLRDELRRDRRELHRYRTVTAKKTVEHRVHDVLNEIWHLRRGEQQQSVTDEEEQDAER